MPSYSNFSHKSRKNKDNNFGQRFDQVEGQRNINDAEKDLRLIHAEKWKTLVSYFRKYPDMFLEFISDGKTGIELYFYQRIYLRIMLRFQNVFITATRGTSKSYLQNLAFIIRCILYPNSKLFIVAPGKEQAAKITQEKIDDILVHFPYLRNEIKTYKKERDYTRLEFYNNSFYDVIVMSNSTRGGRRVGGCIEEICDDRFEPTILNSVVLPLMSNNRFATCQKSDPTEPVQKSQLYITTASNKQNFAYEKAKEIHDEMLAGKNSFFIGNSYQLPCLHNILDPDYVESMKNSPTYSTFDFMKEYESIYVGSSTDSLVSIENLKKSRYVKVAEWEAVDDDDVFYVLAYDVARTAGHDNALSSLFVIKCTNRGDGTLIKEVVNIFSMEGTHETYQAKFLKQKVEEFNARILVVDANGVGNSVVGQLVFDLGDGYPPYSVVNSDKDWAQFYQPDSIPIVYAVKSNAKETLQSDMVNHFFKTFSKKDVGLLISPEEGLKEYCSKHKLKISELDSDDRMKIQMPYMYTDLLQGEIMNLKYKMAGNNRAMIEQISRTIPKDKQSALMYGLWWIYTEEMNMKMPEKKKRTKLNKFAFF